MGAYEFKYSLEVCRSFGFVYTASEEDDLHED